MTFTLLPRNKAPLWFIAGCIAGAALVASAWMVEPDPKPAAHTCPTLASRCPDIDRMNFRLNDGRLVRNGDLVDAVSPAVAAATVTVPANETRLPRAGETWRIIPTLREGDPFGQKPLGGAVTISEVRKGWVQYSIGPSFPDERDEIAYFLKHFKYESN